MIKMLKNLRQIAAWGMIIIAGFGMGCSKKGMKDQTTILAEIKDQTITVEDFKMRTEMTRRPKYPALTNEEIKRICLNNLIAEKLMAIEGQNEKQLAENTVFKAQIKGIQEQAMREQLYIDMALKRVRVDSSKINKVYPLAGRKYRISYYTIYNDTLAEKFGNVIKRDPKQFENLFYAMTSEERIPQRTVNFKDSDPVVVNDSLYSRALKVGEVIGPLKIEDNNHLMMKIEDWSYQPAIGETDVQLRYRDVEIKLKEKAAYHEWQNYITDLMMGKKVTFEKETFNQMARIFFDIYGAREKAVSNKALKDFLSSQTEIRFNNQLFQNLTLNQPFFTIDDKSWTVRDFKQAFMSHPLVFRYKSDNLKHFQYEFRMAILGLIRDHYLTKAAYKKKLEKSPMVKKTKSMWEDNYLALYHRDRYLNTVLKRKDFDPQMMKGKNNYLSLYIDSLQQKYSGTIKVNLEALDNIELSHIDMLALKPNMPYPVAVPAFPEYLQDGKFDYGKQYH